MQRSSTGDTAVIIYTSGTTDKPKGAELTHVNLWFIAVTFVDIFKNNKDDVTLLVLPLFHIFGMAVMMNVSVYRACANVLLPRFDTTTVLETMQQHWLLNYTPPGLDDSSIKTALKICVWWRFAARKTY